MDSAKTEGGEPLLLRYLMDVEGRDTFEGIGSEGNVEIRIRNRPRSVHD